MSATERAAALAGVAELVQAGGGVRWAVAQLGLSAATYYRWRRRVRAGQPGERSDRGGEHGPLPEEAAAAIAYARAHPRDGYRRLAWQMVDEDIAYLSPSAVYRLLDQHDLLYRWKRSSPSGGARPTEATRPDEVWHTDLLYLWANGRWYFLVSVLDAYSRFIVDWELALTLVAVEVTDLVARALEGRPGIQPRIVHDHGSQFVAKEWRQLVAQFELVDIATRVRHPESNGRIERSHRTVREEALSDRELHGFVQAKEVLAAWVGFYNEQRLHAALHYLRPADYYQGDPQALLAERQRKLTEAARRRQAGRATQHQRPVLTIP